MSGLYFHIPFCKNKCPYCSFYSVKYNENYAKQYVDEIIEKMKQYQGSFDTVYFGGGTPSIIAPELIGKILNSARNQFFIDEKSEITIECNPSNDLSESLKKYASYGINRISLGMQSAVKSERLALGRTADKKQIEKAIIASRKAGIDNISLDLMLGTPKQTLSSLDESLDFIYSMGVNHISAYMLSVEEGTPFYKMEKDNRLNVADEDLVCEMYLKTVEYLNSIGLKQYEISNFAKLGFESKHNNKYWTLEPYLGIGKSAHSFWNGNRFYYDMNWNKIDDGQGGDLNEEIMLGLRLSKGVPKSKISKDYSSFVSSGMMVEIENNVALTPKGMLLSNIIIGSLLT